MPEVTQHFIDWQYNFTLAQAHAQQGREIGRKGESFRRKQKTMTVGKRENEPKIDIRSASLLYILPYATRYRTQNQAFLGKGRYTRKRKTSFTRSFLYIYSTYTYYPTILPSFYRIDYPNLKLHVHGRPCYTNEKKRNPVYKPVTLLSAYWTPQKSSNNF